MARYKFTRNDGNDYYYPDLRILATNNGVAELDSAPDEYWTQVAADAAITIQPTPMPVPRFWETPEAGTVHVWDDEKHDYRPMPLSVALQRYASDFQAQTNAPDASTGTKGLVKLAGDLAGTASAPTVPGLADKVSESEFLAGLTGKAGVADLSAVQSNYASVQGQIDAVNTTVNTANASVQALGNSKGQANGVAGLDGSGHVPAAQLGSGSASAATYLRGDGIWFTPPTGGGGGGGSGGLPTWYVNVKDYGATGNGTTDDSSAIAAARDAWIAARGGSDGNNAQKILFFPPGRYRVTVPDTLLDPGPELIRGGSIQGAGSNSSVILFQPTATNTPTLSNRNLMTWTDSPASGGRVRGLRVKGIGFDCNNSTASFAYSWSTQAAPNDNVWFEDCRFTGSWNRVFGLDGDSAANLNSEMRFVGIAFSGSTTFADAFFHSGITSPTVNSQQDQFLNYWFTDCKFEYGSGDLLKFDRGGNINLIGGSYIGVDEAAGGRFIVLTGSSHNDGVCRLLVHGVRFEVRSAAWKVIDCKWTKGNITFKSCMDSGLAYQSFGPNTVAHLYDWSASNRGPMAHYEDCELIGYHRVITSPTTQSFGKMRYDMCRFYNYSSVASNGSTGALRWDSGKTNPRYRFTDCWTIADANVSTSAVVS